MSERFVVIHEAKADFATATEVADRVILEQISWLEESLLDSQRLWIGNEPPGGRRLTWKSLSNRAREQGIRVHGHFDGEPGLPDARAARRAIAFARQMIHDLQAIVLIRDADDQIERKKGLEQARAVASGCTIVVGVAVCERECWVISGFEPRSESETLRLKSEIHKLGWNPCLRSHELTAVKNDSALKSPKRVLAALTDSDRDRQRDCWIFTSLHTLRERGQGNGLRDYLREVQSRLVPLIAKRDCT